jgi:hypothetical protein
MRYFMDARAYATFIPKISTISKWAQKSNEKGDPFIEPPAVLPLSIPLLLGKGKDRWGSERSFPLRWLMKGLRVFF